MFSVFAFAQNRTTINTVPAEPANSFKKTNIASYKKLNTVLNNKTSNQVGSAWFNKVDNIEFLNTGVQVFSAMHVFPDSAITLGFGTSGAVYPFVHKAANYMDPSYMFNQSIITDKLATYYMDSVSVGYIYERNTGTSDNTADSLIIQVIAENHALDYTLTGPPAFPYQDITYSYTTNNLTGMTVLKRLSIPLTYADTCAGGVYKQIKAATPGIAAQANSKKIGVVISFKPGYTYTMTDVLIGDGGSNPATKNAFFILSSEENGDGGGTTGTDPTITGVPSDYTSDMNMSYLLSTDTRYNISSSGWNGYLIPTFAFTTAFSYEHHDIGYKLRVASVGVNELEQKGFALGQNVPNPFTNSSVVSYQLAKDVNSAVFTVTDVMGRVVSFEKVGTTTGTHTINLGAYAAGIYNYSLNVDGNITTKKMIVE